MCPNQQNVSNANTMHLSTYSYVPYSTQREQREHYVPFYVYLCAYVVNIIKQSEFPIYLCILRLYSEPPKLWLGFWPKAVKLN